jgi:DNA-binding MarR family transcriptional regulator
MTATAPLARRATLADSILAVFPQLKRRFTESLPAEVRESLSAVTWHQVEALHQLRESAGGAGATMTELARLQHCALSSATALVDRLLSQGLAERRPDPGDRRVIRIAPTALGEDLLARFQSARKRMALNAFAPLSDAELEILARLLRKIAFADEEPVNEMEVGA